MISWLKQKLKNPSDFQIGFLTFVLASPVFAAIVALHLALTACVGSPLPKAENKQRLNEIRQLDCNVPYRESKIHLAKTVFYSVWLDNFKDPDLAVGMNLDRLCVEFSKKRWKVDRGYYEDGKRLPIGGANVLGQTFNRSYIRVYSAGKDTKLYKTSFAHELVHASLMALNGQADPDHLGNKYKGWTLKHSQLIDRVNAELLFLGL